MNRKNKNIITSLLLVAAGLVILLSLVILYYSNNLKAVNPKNDEIIYFDVKKGDTFYSIADRLDSENLIKNETIFKLFIKLNKPNGLQAGTYELSQNLNVKAIIDKFTAGNTINLDAINITFPEGITIEEMADIIAKNTNNSRDEVLKIWNDKSFLNKVIEKYWFVTDDILKDDIRYGLEGYLFPSTYEFVNKDVTPETIAYRLLDQMDKVLTKYKDQINNSNMTVHEILTLASIVEYEAILDEDRYMVSGVFHNRLNKGMKLESCATLGYALNKHKLVYTTKDTQVKSPYNTYYVTGLPVGPGGVPSEKSIDAALNPASHEYFFFLANVYDTKDKKTYYAKTYAEHLANKKKYLNK